MSEDTKTFEPLPLSELTYYVLNNGLPVFVANVDNIFDHVEASWNDFYYVIANEKIETKNGHQTVISYEPKVFKVINTFLGRAILDASDEVDLGETQENAWFALPKIPYTLVRKMDQFFRAVHDKHGTESILLLTFDTTKQGDPAGWGILVPEQENTAADCDYKPDSVVDSKPDHVQIVGSAHSHPLMAAYASGTDHKDQATFDGLHITFGWMKSVNNGATEYHIELQFGGKAFVFQPAQIFDDIPLDQPDQDVLEWTDKVKKKTWGHTNTGYFNTGSTTSGHSSSAYNGSNAKPKLPSDAPNPQTHIIVAVLDSENHDVCPFCDTILVAGEKAKRKCLTCHGYLLMPNEDLADLIRIREQHNHYTYELDPKNNPPKTVIAWKRNGNTNVYETLYEKGAVGELGK